MASALFHNVTCVSQAADNRLIVDHLTPADGLPQADVTAIWQDSLGFMWFGTEEGLARYDGNSFSVYDRSGKPGTALPGNLVHQIIEDDHHDLWLTLKDSGVARWDRKTDTFKIYRHELNDGTSISSNAARSVLADRMGRIWIGTSDNGIDILESSSGKIEHLHHDSGEFRSLSSNRIFTLALDRAGRVWVGTDAGLDRWEQSEHLFSHFPVSPSRTETTRPVKVSQVREDRAGTLWIGTFDGGLIHLDRDGVPIRTFRHERDKPGSLASDDVRAILEDRTGHLWIGTEDGLDLYDPSAGTFTHYRHLANDTESLRDSFIMALFEDDSGLIWIGTRTGGVDRWNPRSWDLGAYRPSWLQNKVITAFAEGNDSQLWVGSLGGLTAYDLKQGTARKLDEITGMENALGDAEVMSMRSDFAGNLWIGTTRGLKRLSSGAVLQTIEISSGGHGAGVMSILEPQEGQLWLGTFGSGIRILDAKTGAIRQLPYSSTSEHGLSAPIVTSMAYDSRGYVWVGTDGGGLDLTAPDGKVLQVYRNDPANSASLPSDTVYAIAIDGQKRVWVATESGLVQVIGIPARAQSIRFERLAPQEGLSRRAVYGLIPDGEGNIWTSSNAGLAKLNPINGIITTFHVQDGLHGEEFSFNAFLKLKDGRVCFGGPGGFNLFSPERVSRSGRPPRVVLTGVDGFEARANAGPAWELDHLSIDYGTKIVALDFGVLDFTSPRYNRIAYQIADLTNGWVDLGSAHRITLTNLDPGDHVLEVRASNSNSVWNSEPLKLKLHRDPPPWRSLWAYALYMAAGLATIFGIWWYQRTRFLRVATERQLLDYEVKSRTKELVESNRQLAEAVTARTNFLDRMSHELRTPMNGVIGMTELLNHTPLSAKQAHLVKTVRSSALVLLQIVNDLLDVSKIRAGRLTLEQLPFNLLEVLEECASLFAGALETKGVELIICPPPKELLTVVGDSVRVRQILMNLVGNAVKFTQHGEIVVKASLPPGGCAGNVIELTVSDTGIGIAPGSLTSIFEPFSQADESITRHFGGTGLGLTICRELTHQMKGEITVDSTVGRGTKFRVSLPLRQSYAEDKSMTSRGLAVISTRRPSLAESLCRYALALGWEPLLHDGLESLPPEAILAIVDISTCLDYFKQIVTTAALPVVAISSLSEIESEALTLVSEDVVVQKPVQLQPLQRAMEASLRTSVTEQVNSDPKPSLFRTTAHVLVVEDEAVNAFVAKGYLENFGCSALWVDNGSAAIERCETERFDLILMDVNMPGVGGIEASRIIRQGQTPDSSVPIIALTAHTTEAARQTCLDAGMNAILTKPYTIAAFEEMLKRWVPRETSGITMAQAIPTPSALAPLDLSALAEVDQSAIAGVRGLSLPNGNDLYMDLVRLFERGCSAALLELDQAFSRGDLKAAAAICHRLKSASANVGAVKFSEAVKELEQHCESTDANGAEDLHAKLKQAYPQLVASLAEVLRLSPNALPSSNSLRAR